MNRKVGHAHTMGIYIIGMRGSRKFCQRGSIFDNGFFLSFFFFFLEGRDDPNKYHYKRALIGLPAKRHLNGVSLACRLWPKIECWYGSLWFFNGSGPVLLRNPIFLWFYRAVGPDPLHHPPLNPPIFGGLGQWRRFHLIRQRTRVLHSNRTWPCIYCRVKPVCADPKGGQWVWTPPPPLKNHENMGFLCNTGPDPLKNHKTTKPAFIVGPSSARQLHAIQMAFRWRADDGPIILVLLGSSLPSSIKTLSELDPL